jgi:hypothetical protein
MCIDYRSVYEVKCKDTYTLPRMENTLDELNYSKCYTHLDFASNVHKTAFHAHDGMME